MSKNNAFPNEISITLIFAGNGEVSGIGVKNPAFVNEVSEGYLRDNSPVGLKGSPALRAWGKALLDETDADILTINGPAKFEVRVDVREEAQAASEPATPANL